MSRKICTKCSEEKDINQFGKDKRHLDGHTSWCRICVNSYNNARHHSTKSFYKKDYSSNPNKYTNKRLIAQYGITLEQYNSMLVDQNNSCAVCNRSETALDKNGKLKALSVDHCHDTGKIRGLLCDSCNRAEGFLQSNVDIIRKLADYVEKHKNGLELTSPNIITSET